MNFYFINKLSKTRRGEVSVIFSVFLWSLFPIITILSYSWINHMFSLAWNTLFSTIFFWIVLSFQKNWWEFKVKWVFLDLILLTIFNWILFYFLFFWWLSKTTAWNAWIIALMEIFFSFIFMELLIWDKSPVEHKYWAILMAIWAIIVLFPWEIKLNPWDVIILVATLMPTAWNFFIKRARRRVSASFIMFFRWAIASFFWLIFAYTVYEAPSIDSFKNALPFLLINWMILLWFSKILWIEWIFLIPIQKATTFVSIAPVFTLMFAYLILNEMPTVYQVIWLIPIVAWWILVTRK